MMHFGNMCFVIGDSDRGLCIRQRLGNLKMGSAEDCACGRQCVGVREQRHIKVNTINQQVGNPMRERWFVLKDRDTTYMRQLLELGMQDSSLYKPTFSLIQPGNKKCVFKEAD